MLRQFLTECLEEAYKNWLKDNEKEYAHPEEIWKEDFCESTYEGYVDEVVQARDKELWYCTKNFMNYMLCKSILTGEEF